MKKEVYMVYQQGDLLLEVTDSIPDGLRKHNEVLAEGEATGHAHKIAPVDLSNVDIFVDENGELFVQAEEQFTIVHEEHKPLTLPKGDYKVRRVLEYDHFTEEARKVRD